MAACRGHSKVVELLLRAGADKDAAMHDGRTALHEAADRGHSDVLNLLLEAGADTNMAEKSEGSDKTTRTTQGNHRKSYENH